MGRKSSPGKAPPTPSSPSPDLYSREYNDGHKTLTSIESKAVTELLKSENRKREIFYNNYKKEMLNRPRNPLVGEDTPRNERNEAILNSSALLSAVNGIPLRISKDSRTLPPEKVLNGKIGVDDDKYMKTLGNSADMSIRYLRDANTPSMDPYTIAMKEESERRERAQREKVEGARGRAERQRRRQEIELELYRLKTQLRDKKRELEVLRASPKYCG